MKIKTPPLSSSGLNTHTKNIYGTQLTKNYIGYMTHMGCDFQQTGPTFILSTVYPGAHGSSILKSNFKKWCTIYLIRKSPKVTWYNNQFPYFEPMVNIYEN